MTGGWGCTLSLKSTTFHNRSPSFSFPSFSLSYPGSPSISALALGLFLENPQPLRYSQRVAIYRLPYLEYTTIQHTIHQRPNTPYTTEHSLSTTCDSSPECQRTFPENCHWAALPVLSGFVPPRSRCGLSSPSQRSRRWSSYSTLRRLSAQPHCH